MGHLKFELIRKIRERLLQLPRQGFKFNEGEREKEIERTTIELL